MNIRITEKEITQARLGSMCYMCITPICLKPSKEHIIPHSLGSNLISRSILCESCNNSLGSNIDSQLSSSTHLHHYAFGELKPSAKYSKTTALDGTPYQMHKLNVGGIRHPKLVANGESSSVQVPNSWTNQQAKTWLNSELSQRDLTPMDISWGYDDSKKTILSPVGTTNQFIDPETVPGMVKIGCNYWAAVCDHPIPEVLRRCILDSEIPVDWTYRTMGHPAFHYQFYIKPLSQIEPGYHTLTAVGDPKNGLGYVDVNLFGVQTFRVIIDFGYTSEPFYMKVSMKAFDNSTREYSSEAMPTTPRREIVNNRLWDNSRCAKQYNAQLKKFADAYGMKLKDFEKPISRHISWKLK